jgi:hypothetical protein
MSDRLPNGQFPPGVSGNPGGMVRGRSITGALRLLVAGDPESWACVREIDAGAPEGTHEKFRIAVTLIRESRKDMAAMRELLDRHDGKLAAAYSLPDDGDRTQIIRPVLYVAPETPEQVAGLVELLDAAGPVPEGWSAQPGLAPQLPADVSAQPPSVTPNPSEPLIVLVEVAPEARKVPSKDGK